MLFDRQTFTKGIQGANRKASFSMDASGGVESWTPCWLNTPTGLLRAGMLGGLLTLQGWRKLVAFGLCNSAGSEGWKLQGRPNFRETLSRADNIPKLSQPENVIGIHDGSNERNGPFVHPCFFYCCCFLEGFFFVAQFLSGWFSFSRAKRNHVLTFEHFYFNNNVYISTQNSFDIPSVLLVNLILIQQKNTCLSQLRMYMKLH